MEIDFITRQDLHKFKEELVSEIIQHLKGQPEQQEWLKSAEVMKMLKISSGTLQNLRINKTLPFSKIGGTIYYSQKDVMNILNEGRK